MYGGDLIREKKHCRNFLRPPELRYLHNPDLIAVRTAWPKRQGRAQRAPFGDPSDCGLLDERLPGTAIWFAEHDLHFGGIGVIKVGAVLVNERGPIPRIEALDERPGSIEQIAELVWLPFPAIENCGPGWTVHSYF